MLYLFNLRAGGGRAERFKAIELIKSDIRGDRSDTYHTFARHHMYKPNKNNMCVSTLYTIQCSKCSKYLVQKQLSLLFLKLQTFFSPFLLLKTLLCNISYTDNVCSLLMAIQSKRLFWDTRGSPTKILMKRGVIKYNRSYLSNSTSPPSP